MTFKITRLSRCRSTSAIKDPLPRPRIELAAGNWHYDADPFLTIPDDYAGCRHPRRLPFLRSDPQIREVEPPRKPKRGDEATSSSLRDGYGQRATVCNSLWSEGSLYARPRVAGLRREARIMDLEKDRMAVGFECAEVVSYPLGAASRDCAASNDQ
jgi:hypothetical protein